jgi:hypothetical protein
MTAHAGERFDKGGEYLVTVDLLNVFRQLGYAHGYAMLCMNWKGCLSDACCSRISLIDLDLGILSKVRTRKQFSHLKRRL